MIQYDDDVTKYLTLYTLPCIWEYLSCCFLVIKTGCGTLVVLSNVNPGKNTNLAKCLLSRYPQGRLIWNLLKCSFISLVFLEFLNMQALNDDEHIKITI